MKPALAVVIGAAVLFAFNGVVSKMVLAAGFDPLRLTELRSTATFLVILIISIIHRSFHIQRSLLPLIAAYGISEFFVVPGAYFTAIHSLPLGVALLIEYLAPVFVALWSALKHRARGRIGPWAGLGLSVVGLALVGQVWTKFKLDPVGIGFAFLAAVALAIAFVIGEKISPQQSPLSTMLWASCAGAVAVGTVKPWWLFHIGILSSEARGFPIWLLCIDIISLGTVIPYMLLIEGLRRLSATRVGVLMTLEPATGVCLAWVLLGEHLAPVQVLGTLVILGGIVMAEVMGGPSEPDDDSGDSG